MTAVWSAEVEGSTGVRLRAVDTHGSLLQATRVLVDSDLVATLVTQVNAGAAALELDQAAARVAHPSNHQLDAWVHHVATTTEFTRLQAVSALLQKLVARYAAEDAAELAAEGEGT